MANTARFLKWLIILFLTVFPAGCATHSNVERTENNIPIDIVFTGVAVSTQIDTNGDGISTIHLAGRLLDSDLGAVGLQEAVEVQPKDPVIPCTTPGSGEGIEYELVQGHLVHHIEETAEYITMKFGSNEQCIPVDPSTDPRFSFSGELIVTGGTGKFEDASGTIDFEGEGEFLLSHDTGDMAVATATHKGTIILNQ